MTVERAHDRSFTVRDAEGAFVCSIHFRALLALVAVRHGAARMVERRRQAYGMVDTFLAPDCELYGVGYGTLTDLQRGATRRAGARSSPARPSPGRSSSPPLGAEVLDLIGALPDVRLPEVVVPA